MKRPSAKTLELLRSLYASRNLWERLTGNDVPISALEEIVASNEQLVIPQLAGLLLHQNEEVRDATAWAIGKLVESVRSSEFVQLDEACRNDWSYEGWVPKLRDLKPKDVQEISALPTPGAVVGVLSCHGSGFVREAAVKKLAGIFDGSELPFLLLRLNDWVGVIRETAATAVLQRIRADYIRPFFRHLPLILRLRGCGRSHHEQIVAAVTALLKQPAAAPVLREGIASEDRWFRREAFRLVVESGTADSVVLLKQMLADRDPIMRLWTVRGLLPRLHDDELRSCLPLLIRDRFMPVRCEGLNLMVKRFPESGRAVLDEALLDSHASVRALARYWIRTGNAEYDFAFVYRQVLGSPIPARQRAAIFGLGETGAVVDADLLLPCLHAQQVSICKAAIRAIAVLAGDQHVECLLDALTHAHPGISREASRALAPRACMFAARLLEIFRSEIPLHVRKNAFTLILVQPFWKRGLFLFEALRDREEQIITEAGRALRDWMVRSRSMALMPTTAEIRELRNALKASAGMLNPHEVSELEFCFNSYK